MKNVLKLLMILILITTVQVLFAQDGVGIPPSIRENITAILMKPVPSGSTLRYENLVKYLKKLDIGTATKIIDQIENKTPFGESFYHRMSHSTVDKKILPLLKDIEGGAYLEDATKEPTKPIKKPTKPKSKKPILNVVDNPENEPIAIESPKIKIRNITVKRDLTITNIFAKSWKLEISNSKLGANIGEIFFEENHDYTVDELSQAIFISSDWNKYYDLNKTGKNTFILKQEDKNISGKEVIETEILNKL